jgi:hypothetical protein
MGLRWVEDGLVELPVPDAQDTCQRQMDTWVLQNGTRLWSSELQPMSLLASNVTMENSQHFAAMPALEAQTNKKSP